MSAPLHLTAAMIHRLNDANVALPVEPFSLTLICPQKTGPPEPGRPADVPTPKRLAESDARIFIPQPPVRPNCGPCLRALAISRAPAPPPASALSSACASTAPSHSSSDSISGARASRYARPIRLGVQAIVIPSRSAWTVVIARPHRSPFELASRVLARKPLRLRSRADRIPCRPTQNLDS
jgi:hypothetical protein